MMSLALVDTNENPEPASYGYRRAMYKGAEYLVLADLSLRGLTCYPASEGLSYDLVADLGGDLRRVQVKSTSRPLVKKRYGAGGRDQLGYLFEGDGLSKYASAADVMAFVALDRRMVLYMASATMGRRLLLKPDRFSEDACRLSAESCFPVLGTGGIRAAQRA